ncbi:MULTISPECIES: hypothetical protein [unclassified Sphingobacterium]|uniref:hypothetical protein n=1 Tax=unclassified Sphingobacterium TaxID=2609468 RepID=UPI001AE889CB|nr:MULTISPECIES: hypothetical protein [unclassified Sphingobacterium]MDR6736742.1 hypothetical protein [Sphingobacterium sp. 2149]
MKTVITIFFFLCFLVIRSSNSHAVLIESDRPAVSFMHQHNHADLQQYIDASADHIDPLVYGSIHDDNPVIAEFDYENFQLTKDLHATSQLVSLLLFAIVLFIFVFRFAKKIPFCNFIAYLFPQRYVLQQNWRI